MVTLVSTWNWISTYKGYILIGLVISLLLLREIIKRFFRDMVSRLTDKREQESPIPISQDYAYDSSIDYDLFRSEDSNGSLKSFQRQRAKITRDINKTRIDGKKLVAEEKQFDAKCRQDKQQYIMKRKSMGLQYTNLMNQLRITDEMIENQIRMQDELRKATGGQQEGGRAIKYRG